MASASISTSMSGSISFATSTIDVAGRMRAEDFAVRLADRFPVEDVGDVHARAHDVLEGGARLLQGAADVGEDLHRLRARVALADDLSAFVGGGRARDVHDVADANGAGIADQRLPLRAAGDVHSGRHRRSIRRRGIRTSGLKTRATNQDSQASVVADSPSGDAGRFPFRPRPTRWFLLSACPLPVSTHDRTRPRAWDCAWR